MVSYKIEWKKSAKKDLKQLDKKIIPRIITAVDELLVNPKSGNCKKLQGTEHTYRIRVSDYRIIYSIEKKFLIIEIIRIGHRREIYKGR